MGYDQIGAHVRSRAELMWARNRPLACRPPIPSVGDTVYFRSNDFMPDLILGRVIGINDYDLADPNLWEFDESPQRFGAISSVADPWPLIVLDIGKRYLVETREARLWMAAGWLSLDWQKYWRPIHDVGVDKEGGSGGDDSHV